MTELKQEPKREEKEVENNLGLRTDQYYKKLALVCKIDESLEFLVYRLSKLS